MRSETYLEAEARYRAIRVDVYRVAEKELKEITGLDISFTGITDEIAQEAFNWKYPHQKTGFTPGWSWVAEAKKFRRRPRRVEAAIWVTVDKEKILCGLVLGRISNSRVMATIHFLEGNPEMVTPLSGKVAQVAIRYLELQAVALNCTVIGIANPLPDLVSFYGDLGFSKSITKGTKVKRLERGLGTK